MQRFGSLEVGQKFYLPDQKGEFDLELSLRLMKIGPINFSEGFVSNKTKAMESVMENGNSLNATVLSGQNGKFNGYYAFVNKDTLVLFDTESQI